MRLTEAVRGGADTEGGEWVAVGPATPGGHPLEGHFLPQTMTGRAWAPTLPTSSQLRGQWPASLAPSQTQRKRPRLEAQPFLPLPVFSQPFFFKSLFAHLVRTNESDKYWEEYRRRCGLGTLTEVAHNCIVGLLGKGGEESAWWGRRSPAPYQGQEAHRKQCSAPMGWKEPRLPKLPSVHVAAACHPKASFPLH